MTAPLQSLHLYRGGAARHSAMHCVDADPVTTEIIRHALGSAARQMKRATIRTSFSPIIYELLDFAVALYDRKVRMLGQAQTLPHFMGTMGFCIENAVKALGGERALEPGDVLVYNSPYGTGSHAQDCAIILPIFMADGELIGYAANKAHWVDIGASAPYCTNTTNVYQEGVILPGVKFYKTGEINDDVFRVILANCRFKAALEGDLKAQVASCHVGARELLRLIDRYGLDTFRECVERIFDHGERIVREYIQRVPDGVYLANCHMDSNGVDREPIHFEVVVTVSRDRATFDFSTVPDAQKGPTNCPLPATICASRLALAMLSGNTHETLNEGHFRPIEVVTRPGSMFHPVEPQPCYLYGWPLLSAIEGIFEAFAGATGGLNPSGSAGDVGSLVYYGTLDTGEPFYHGTAYPVGQGGLPHADGATTFVVSAGTSQVPSPELEEAKLPILYEKWEFTPDSCGPGCYRGGSGWELHFRMLRDVALTSTLERTRTPGWAQKGGLPGAMNRLEIDFVDGRVETITKVTDLPVPSGSRLRLYLGGGGGYGLPSERDPSAVRQDLLNGLITQEHARKYYYHAL